MTGWELVLWASVATVALGILGGLLYIARWWWPVVCASPSVRSGAKSVAGVVALTWPILLSLVLMLAACVVGPDGRRVLSPGARAVGESMLEHVVRCGLQAGFGAAVSAAANGGAPSEQVLLSASECHIQVAGEQAQRWRWRAAPAPSVEHGRKMLEAQTLEAAGLHDAAIDAALECGRLVEEGGQP